MKININWRTNAELELLEINRNFYKKHLFTLIYRDYNLSLPQLFANDSILLLNRIPLPQH